MVKRIRTRLRELVRHFKENGIKLLLEHPLNVRELLLLLSVRWVKQIDFATLQLARPRSFDVTSGMWNPTSCSRPSSAQRAEKAHAGVC